MDVDNLNAAAALLASGVICGGYWLLQKSLRAKYHELAAENGLKPRWTLRGVLLTGTRGVVDVELRIYQEEGGSDSPADIYLRARLPTQGRLDAVLLPAGKTPLDLPPSAVRLAASHIVDVDWFRAWGKPVEPARDFLLGPKGPEDVFLGRGLPGLRWLRFTPARVELALAAAPTSAELRRLLDLAAKLAVAAADV